VLGAEEGWEAGWAGDGLFPELDDPQPASTAAPIANATAAPAA
jgi:hypothetical protein